VDRRTADPEFACRPRLRRSGLWASLEVRDLLCGERRFIPSTHRLSPWRPGCLPADSPDPAGRSTPQGAPSKALGGADREFVGKKWCAWLRWKGIKRCFRIKETTWIDDLLAKDRFLELQSGEVHSVFKNAWVYGTWMRVAVTLSPAGDRVIVASD